MRRIKPSVEYEKRIQFPVTLFTSNTCYNWMEKNSDNVMQYEDEGLLRAGRELVPLDDLISNAKRSITANMEEVQSSSMMRDYLLVELLDWFHAEFFTWINQIPCRVCGSVESSVGNSFAMMVDPHTLVEKRICCGQEILFYRYNDVAKLLETRQGRCGEFANAFTFFCRCLDYDARLILTSNSFTHSGFDHAWTEVYSEHQDRWIHMDPSENVFDAPLMYECGWNRKIDYVFAFSCNDVQDVTWRYTSNHRQLLEKRFFCSEAELVSVLFILRSKRQKKFSEARKRMLAERCLSELLGFIEERQPTTEEHKCRSSGSLEWRISRGECDPNTFTQFIFGLTDLEVMTQRFNLRYSCATDRYERYSDEITNNGVVQITSVYDGWQSCLYKANNLFRKKERDWHKVYLARNPNTKEAEAVWRFDFSAYDLIVASYELRIGHETFCNGQVRIQMRPIDKDVEANPVASFGSVISNPQVHRDIIGASVFEISAHLSGGEGEEAWQHAQLFRDDDVSREYKFNLQIKLRKLPS